MFGKFTEEEIRKLFFELAEEMEKECGDWEKIPVDTKLRERIIAAVMEYENEKEWQEKNGPSAL